MEKARYWTAVMYTENMIEGWEDNLASKVQLPGFYCVHDKDSDEGGEQRKEHVHIVLCWGNTTTKTNALRAFKRLEKEGCQAIPNDAIQSVMNMRNMWDYVIHDTEECKKKKKHLYNKNERIAFNGFDIGLYEQRSKKEELEMKKELCDAILTEQFTNFIDFYEHVINNYPDDYFDLVVKHSGLFERLTKGNYQKYLYCKGGRVYEG